VLRRVHETIEERTEISKLKHRQAENRLILKYCAARSFYWPAHETAQGVFESPFSHDRTMSPEETLRSELFFHCMEEAKKVISVEEIWDDNLEFDLMLLNVHGLDHKEFMRLALSAFYSHGAYTPRHSPAELVFFGSSDESQIGLKIREVYTTLTILCEYAQVERFKGFELEHVLSGLQDLIDARYDEQGNGA
jgi:hypothetical protein